jgi:nicotinamide riboside transporter PnuC
MSKSKKITPTKQKKTDFEKEVMTKIKRGEITMKPKWFFVVGSLMAGAGLVGASIGAIFLVNLTLFILRKRGPGIMRLELMLTSFPWWIPLLAIIGIVAGIWLLKKYDFSYKKNFLLIIAVFISSIAIAAWFIDYLGLNETWSRHSPTRKFYQQFERQDNNFPQGRGNRFYLKRL